MYAFLSKVFGRKKDDKDTSSSSQPVLDPGELLGGRFEAISPNVSPAAVPFLELDPKFNETTNDKEKEKDAGFSFFKGKWRPASPDVKASRKLDILPHLSLNFQESKTVSATPDLGVLFTTDQILSDAVIGQRRLNPLEALVLIQACSRAIVAKGLDTLGIMHPHWYAASHRIQRRVISHFIYLLDQETLTSTPSPVSPTSPISAFEAEVSDTFLPHDIAAILRWGLRHVQIEGNSLGTDDEWYITFLKAEGSAGYPPKAFSDKLASLLPTSHLQLLLATLEIFSSLAAHAEVNGTSGSKLCKIFGLWLLTAHRVEDEDDWKTFYARWERTGRMLEHLFLSRIRDQSTDQRMPTRLLELVRKYPYTRGPSSPTTDLPLLPHPPFTTRLHDAFFVRIETELPYGKRKPSSKPHPLSLLSDALSTKVEGEYTDLWAKITAASKDGDSPSLCNIFTDDTIRFLSLVPGEPTRREVKSPTFGLASPVSDDADKSEANVAGHPKPATELSPMTLLSPLSNGIGSDWTQFSASGFLEVSPNIVPLASTLLDTDIEKTIPPESVVTPLSRKSSKRSKAASPFRKNVDVPRPVRETSPETKSEGIEEQKNIIKASQSQIIQLDEAFVDFWSDSLLDPISADWPTFIVCKFKSSLVPELTFGVAHEGQKYKTIQWLVLEQVYTIRAPPVVSIPVETVRPRSSSPNSPSTSLRKRFSIWGVSRTASNASGTSLKGKMKDQELKLGEMGDLLEEESRSARVKSPIFKSRKSLDVAQKSLEVTRQSIIKPAEEAKIDEETSAVAAVATSIVGASVATVIANELPTDRPSPVKAVAVKVDVDHSTETETVSTPIATAKTVVPSPEPTVTNDDTPLSAARPDAASSPAAKVETEPLESEDIAVKGTAIIAKAEVHSESELQLEVTEAEVATSTTDSKDKSEAEGCVETEDTTATQGVPATKPDGVIDVPSITIEAPTTTEDIEREETVDEHESKSTVAPLVSATAIPEPQTEVETSVKPDPALITEESPAVFTSGRDISQVIEVAPVTVDHSPLTELKDSDVDNAVGQPEAIELQSEVELKPSETETTSSPAAERAVEIATGKTSGSDTADQQLHQVAEQEIIQPQFHAIPVTEDDRGHQVETVTSSGLDTAKHIEAKDTVVKEAENDLTPAPVVINLEPEIETEASTERVLPSTEQDVSTTVEQEQESAHLAEPATIAEASPEIALDGNTLGDTKVESRFEQDTVTTAQEVGADLLTSTVTREEEAEVEAESHEMNAPIVAASADNLVPAEFTEKEQLVMPTTEDDSTKHVNENFIDAVPLAATENSSTMDKVVSEVTRTPALEAGNGSLNETTLNIEPQCEHKVDAIPDVPLSAPHPDAASSLETKVETEPLESENTAERTAIVAKVEADSESELQPEVTEAEPATSTTDSKDKSETEGHVETEAITATQAIESEVGGVIDVTPITPEAPVTTEVGEVQETVSALAQDGPVVAPLVPEVTIPETEIELEDSDKPDPALITKESHAASEREISQDIEVAPATVDHSPPAESEDPDVENAAGQPETIEVQSEVELKPGEAESMLSPVEEAVKITTGETGDSDTDGQPLHQVAKQEIIQPQFDAIPIAEDDGEHQAKVITPPTTLEGAGAVEHIEAKDTVVKEAEDDLAAAPVVTNLEPEIETEASTEPVSASVQQDLLTSVEHEPETTYSDEPAAISEGSPDVALALGDTELESGLEQETLVTPQETGGDARTGTAVATHEVEAKGETESHETDALVAAASVEDLVPAVSIEKEQPVISTTGGDSTEPADEAVQLTAVVKEAKNDLTPAPTATNLQPEIETEASTEHVSASIQQDLLTSVEHEPEAHSDEPDIALDRNALGDNELESGLEQETLSTAQETRLDASSTAVTHEAETEGETGTHGTDALVAATTVEDLVPAEFTEKGHPVISTTEGDSPKHADEAVQLATVVKEAKNDLAPAPAIINLEHENETDASAEPVPTFGQDFPISVGQESEMAHSDEPAAISEGPLDVALDKNALGNTELESGPEQETLTTAQETRLDAPSTEGETETHGTDALVAATSVEDLISAESEQLATSTSHEVEAEGETESHGTDATVAATSVEDLVPAESIEKEQPVMSTTEGDSTKHDDAVQLATAEDFSSVDTVMSEVTHTAAPQAGNDSLESETTLNIEPQRERDVDAIPDVSAPHPDAAEPKIETEPLESENIAERTTIVAKVEADSELKLKPEVTEAEPTSNTDSKEGLETENCVETEAITAAQAVPAIESEVASVTDVAPITTETPTTTESIEGQETVNALAENGPVVAPLVPEVTIPEPEIELEDSDKPEPTLTTEESHAASEREISQDIEVAPATIEHSPLPESEDPDIENPVRQPEITELQSEVELKPGEAESMPSPVEEKAVEITTGKTGDSDIVDQPSHQVAEQEIIQPQFDVIPIVEDNGGRQGEVVTSSTDSEGVDTAEHIEAQDIVAKEVADLAPAPVVTNLEPEIKTEASAEPTSASIEQDLPTSVKYEPETTHSDGPAVISEGSPDVALDRNALDDTELEPRLEQETPATAQETGGDARTAVATHEVEPEEETESHETEAIVAVTSVEDLIPAESTEKEQPVISTTEGDSTEHADEAVQLTTVDKEAEDGLTPTSAVTNLEPKIETEASTESVSASIQQGLLTSVEHEPEIAHSDEPAAISEGSPDIALDRSTLGGDTELGPRFEQETLATAQETGVDPLTAAVTHKVETEEKTESHETDALVAATGVEDLTSVEFIDKEPLVTSTTTTEDDSTEHVDKVVQLATSEGFSSANEVESEITHTAAPESGNDSLESGAAFAIEPQCEREVDAILDIPSNLRNGSTAGIEPEVRLVKTDEIQVEPAPKPTIEAAPIDVQIQPVTETPSNTQDDIKVETQVDDTSNFKNEPTAESDTTNHIQDADIEALEGSVPV